MLTLEEFREGIRTADPEENCPVAKTLELLTGKWTARIMFELQKAETVRFGELKRNLGSTPCCRRRSKPWRKMGL